MAQKAHAHAYSTAHSANGYHRRRPEETELYKTIAAWWHGFLERAEQMGGLPDFVKKEFEAYLDCGILERGFVSVKCSSCGFERLVGFSCKTRSFCPSCVGRRMNDTAVHLVDCVLPEVPIRQWVCSMPFSIRYLIGYDKKLCADILSAFASELMHFYKMRGKQALGLRSVNQAHSGAVTILQRFDSALRLNPHAHTLALDGVYVRDESSGLLVFHPLPVPTHQEVEQLASRIAAKCEKVMRKHGRWVDQDNTDSEQDQLSLEHPALATCYQASVSGVEILSERAGRPCLRLLTDPPAITTVKEPGAMAMVRGFSVHGIRSVDGKDRDALEKLCRYIARPPIAQERLHLLDDGRIRYDLKHVWKDGTKAIVLSPLDFIARLCALVPPPYFHLTRFHGLLAPNSALRAEVVPKLDAQAKQPEQLELFDVNDPNAEKTEPSSKPHTGGRLPWAWLLKRVFKVEITVCPKCQGSLKIIELVTDSATIAKRLAEAGLGPMPPQKPPPPIKGQLALKFD